MFYTYLRLIINYIIRMRLNFLKTGTALTAVLAACCFSPVKAQERVLLPLKNSSDPHKAVAYSAPHRAAATSLTVMASTPEGMEFAGVDENEQSMGDYAFAPAFTFLSTSAKSTSRTASYSWTYSTLDNKNNVVERSSRLNSINFLLSDGLHPAPVVTAKDSSLTASFSLAADGIYFGQGKSGNHDCVNYHPAQVFGYFIDPSSLTLNSAEADSTMNYLWAGVGLSNFNLHGFAEMFNYNVPYYLEAVTAEVYCPTQLTAGDIEAHIVKRTKSSSGYRIDTVDIAKLHVSQIIPSQLGNRYRVVFEPDEAPQITTPIAVRIQTPENSSCKLSAVFPETKVYNSDNTAGSGIYADFNIGSSQIKKQILDFAGIEIADDSGKSTGYLNNFVIGLRKSYEKPVPAGIESVKASVTEDDTVYDISGRYFGKSSSVNTLPKGIYIIGGKKVIK